MPLSAGVAQAPRVQIASARLWPAQEYTRVIVESAAPLAYQLQVLLQQPKRLVLDLDGVDASPELGSCRSRVQRQRSVHRVDSRRHAVGRAACASCSTSRAR